MFLTRSSKTSWIIPLKNKQKLYSSLYTLIWRHIKIKRKKEFLFYYFNNQINNLLLLHDVNSIHIYIFVHLLNNLKLSIPGHVFLSPFFKWMTLYKGRHRIFKTTSLQLSQNPINKKYSWNFSMGLRHQPKFFP